MNNKNVKHIYKKCNFNWKRIGYQYYVRFHYYRHIRTNQEIRENDFIDSYDIDSKEYGVKIRRSRSKKMIPTSWDDHFTYGKKSWKDVTKCRKQWEVNL